LARYIALDWDQNQLSIVAVNVRGRTVRIERAATFNEEHSPNPAEAADLGKHLRERLREAGIAPAPLLVCLARDRVSLKEIRFPAVPDDEEPDLVRFQAVKDLSEALDEVVIDYTRFPTPPEATERRALVLIARKELVTAYQTLAAAAGLKLVTLTPRPFGLAACVRSLIDAGLLPPPEAEEGREPTVAVVAVAERWAEFAIFRGRTLLLTRSLNAGPQLAGEVRRNLTVYAGSGGQQPVKAVYLAGGDGSELRQRLSDMLTVPVHPFTPFAGSESVNLPEGANRGTFAAAIGVAHAYGASALPINFIRPTQPRPRANPQRARILVGALLLIALLAGGIVWGRSETQKAIEKAGENEQESAAVDKKLKDVKTDQQMFAGIELWDGPRLTDEMYDLTSRIKNVNLLRISEVRYEQTREVKPETKTKAKEKEKVNDILGKLTIKGTLVDPKNHQPLADFIDQFQADGTYYKLAQAPQMEGSTFTVAFWVKRHPPDAYGNTIDTSKLTKKSPGGEGRPN
jgi:Tfp pilus assembly PilM family ATPase